MIYLDNCATTKVRQEVLEKMYDSFNSDFGNPSSLHRLGLKSEKRVEETRNILGRFLGVSSKEIYFTSGGTESNNIAIQSIVNNMRRRGNHIITTKIEHSSVLNTMKFLEKNGFNVTYLSTDEFGYIDIEEFKEKLTEDTILVSIIHVNNEIGSIQNIKKIKEIMKENNSQALLHLDGVQSFGKIEFSLRDLGVDTYSFSGHKVYGPKGIGGLYVNSTLHLNPIIFGGNQEKGLRSGTENVQGIVGLGEAVRILLDKHVLEAKYVEGLREYMVGKIQREIADIKLNTLIDKNTSPYILNISFRNTRGEVLLHYLEDKGIYVSTGSACSSNKSGKSHVLKAMGKSPEEQDSALRFSLSHDLSPEDMDYTIQVLAKEVKEIRKFVRR